MRTFSQSLVLRRTLAALCVVVGLSLSLMDAAYSVTALTTHKDSADAVELTTNVDGVRVDAVKSADTDPRTTLRIGSDTLLRVGSGP